MALIESFCFFIHWKRIVNQAVLCDMKFNFHVWAVKGLARVRGWNSITSFESPCMSLSFMLFCLFRVRCLRHFTKLMVFNSLLVEIKISFTCRLHCRPIQWDWLRLILVGISLTKYHEQGLSVAKISFCRSTWMVICWSSKH